MGSLPCIQISELGRLFLDYGGAKFYRFDLFSRSERSRVLESWTRLTGSAGVSSRIIASAHQLAAVGSQHSGTAIILHGRR